MSKEFALIMEAISGDTIDEKIKTFSDVLDKITQFAVNSLDQLTKKVGYLEALAQNLQVRLMRIEQNAPALVGSYNTAPLPTGINVQAPAPMPPPPAPVSPVSVRSALQGELKALFARKKKE